MIRYVLAFLGLSTGAVAAPSMTPAALTEMCGSGAAVVVATADLETVDVAEPVEADAVPESRSRAPFMAVMTHAAIFHDAPLAGSALVFGVYIVPAVAADGSDPRADFCP